MPIPNSPLFMEIDKVLQPVFMAQKQKLAQALSDDSLDFQAIIHFGWSVL
jgi:hypothetical protein